MKVLVADEVWGSTSVDPLELAAVLRLCDAGRHILQLSPSGRKLAAAWVERHACDLLRARLMHVLEDNHRRAPNIGAQWAQITVVVEGTDWTRARLTAPLASRLLARPLKLLVENSRNDRAFLLQIAEPAARRSLNKAIKAGWIEFEMGGGILEILQRVRGFIVEVGSLDDQAWIELARLWVMFDRDANPDDRSQESDPSCRVRIAAAQLIRPWALAAHQLERRAIENYVPGRTLRDWWCGQARTSKQRIERDKRVEAFLTEAESAGLTREARRFYNMKRGLLGDVTKACREEVRRGERTLTDGDLDPMFRGLSPEVRDRLAGGGFDDAAAAFSAGVIDDRALSEEVNRAERRRLIGSIQDRM